MSVERPAPPPVLREAEDAGEDVGLPAARVRLLSGSAFLTALLLLVLITPPGPFAIRSPGRTVDTLGEVAGGPLIVVEGARTYPTAGSLLLTSVETRGGPRYPVDFVRVLRGWLSPQESVVPVEEVYPQGVSREEYLDLLGAQMTSSQENATVAALTELGYDVPARLLVAGTVEESGAAGVLHEGDVVVGAGGTEVATFQALVDVLVATPPGTGLAIDVLREGERRQVHVVTHDDGAGGSLLGAFFDPDFDPPVDVRIGIEEIGGPSAGLVFALGIVDTLTPGVMTGGERIAGTGTITLDGTVGAVSNVGLKRAAAARDGASYFLVPAANCRAAEEAMSDGPRVVGVTTLAQARAAVTAIGEGRLDELPGCSG